MFIVCSIRFAKYFFKVLRRLSTVSIPFVFSPNGLHSSNFLFLCNSHFPGGFLASLSQHRNVFNTNPGKRTLGMLDTQKFRPKTFKV